jgi:hypothetical protein
MTSSSWNPAQGLAKLTVTLIVVPTVMENELASGS